MASHHLLGNQVQAFGRHGAGGADRLDPCPGISRRVRFRTSHDWKKGAPTASHSAFVSDRLLARLNEATGIVPAMRSWAGADRAAMIVESLRMVVLLVGALQVCERESDRGE